MQTETIASSISSSDFLYFITEFAAPNYAEQSAKVARVTMPPPSMNGTGHLVKTPWHIHLRHDSRPDHEMAIELRGEVTLGIRLNPGDATDIDVRSWNGYKQGVSRRHLVLRPTENSLFAIDLNSSNGSFFNGLPMSADRAYKLHGGDLLSLANLHLYIVQIARTASPEVGAGDLLVNNELAPPRRVSVQAA